MYTERPPLTYILTTAPLCALNSATVKHNLESQTFWKWLHHVLVWGDQRSLSVSSPVFLPLSSSQVEKWAGFFVNPPVGGVSSFPVSYTCHVLQTDRRSCSLTDFCHQYGGKLMCLNSCVSQTVNHFSPLFPHPCPKAQAEVPSWKFSRCMIFQPHLLC